jgi:hypothetical protein
VFIPEGGGCRANRQPTSAVYFIEERGLIMNRFDWTFSGSAELVMGLLLAALIIAAAFA